ncbi:hypothetical protein NARC_10014 [Candidatus Nitrosocosmicus arcticus]|uniref:Uncharacterized protein n=1 Tax=Candidatus Nitrosocosmicus arcticus TaxID=2035267 RepID=A0A557SYC4_9ARCH|nr:hypothetical protein NARC_10014 [Candidatus Nitrosocosmicus arcticus]
MILYLFLSTTGMQGGSSILLSSYEILGSNPLYLKAINRNIMIHSSLNIPGIDLVRLFQKININFSRVVINAL